MTVHYFTNNLCNGYAVQKQADKQIQVKMIIRQNSGGNIITAVIKTHHYMTTVKMNIFIRLSTDKILFLSFILVHL